ncbi:PAS domain S-box protein [Calothrix sp. CCY 0018]|uniref:PAS domain S-box protein n=1 Tax=Calothrix sp. CCY 0018 TaxID=3103864 RepID=UPI0039C66D4A
MVLALANGDICACNATVETILGCSITQIQGNSSTNLWKQTIDRDGSLMQSEMQPAMVALQTSEPCHNVVMGFYKPDGSLIWLNCSSQPLFQAGTSAPYATVTTFSDITRKIRQNNIQNNIPSKISESASDSAVNAVNNENVEIGLSDTKFFNISLDLMCVAGFDRYFKRLNPAFSKTLGYSTEELLATSFLEFVHPEDRDATIAEVEKLNTGVSTVYFENRYRTQDGSYKWLAWTAVAAIEKQLLYGVARDITERKQLETSLQIANQELKQCLESQTTQLEQANINLSERETLYRSLAKHIPNSIVFLFDRDLRYLLCEGTELEVIGLDNKEIIGKTPREIFSTQTISQIEPIYRAALAGQTTVNEIAYDDRVYSSYTVPILNERGEIFAGMVLTQNITNRKRNEALLTAQNQVLALISTGASLSEVLKMLVQSIETQLNQGLCSILLLDKNTQKLYPGVSLSLPKEYTQGLMSGVPMGASEGSCGTAAYTRQTVIVPDIACDRKWENYRELALTNNLQACWSTPIFDSKKNVLGTFAIYYRTPSSPSEWELQLIHTASYLAGLAIERQRALDMLYQKEYQLWLIAETIPQQVWTALPNGQVDYRNQRWYDFTGMKRQDLKTKNCDCVVHPEDLGRLKQLWQEAVQTGNEFQAEIRVRSADGEYHWVLQQARPLRSQEGSIIKWYGTNTDISDRKTTEAELAQKNSILKAVVEGASDAIFVKNLQGGYVIANKTTSEWLGTTVERIVGKQDTELFPSEIAENIARVDKQVLREGESITYSEQIPARGMLVTLLTTKYLWRDEQGNTTGVIGISRDITERHSFEEALRESELNFRTLANTMPQLVWTSLPDGSLNYFNQRCYEYLGMSQEQLQGWGWGDSLHPDDYQSSIDVWNEALCTGEVYNTEFRLRRASDGQYRWFLGKAFALRNDSGEIIKWFGSCTDIDDQKRTEEALQDALQQAQTAHEQAETANRLKDQFLAMLSHELRTPLNPILGWTQLLKRRILNEDKQAEGLKVIERNVKLQVNLIEDLLDISRIMRGKLVMKAAPINLESVMMAALETVRLAAETKAIEIHTEFVNPIGQVTGDEVRLQQVFWNLLSNAIKFTPNGGRVEVKLHRCDTIAQITVSDTGKGINPEFLPYIFHYFRQEDTSISRKFGGLGLGLAIVRNIVEMHGGTIEASSLGEGQGATFRVRLPLASNRKINRESEQQYISQDLSGIKVLVVDDEADSLEYIAFDLQLHGASVTAVSSASAALQILPDLKPDVLVSDIGMPEIDGYQMLRQIRTSQPENCSQIPAIALTAYAGETEQQKALEAGFQMHLSKPVEANAVIAAVAKLVFE